MDSGLTRYRACPGMTPKKIGPVKPGPKAFWGLNRTRNSTGPAGRAPGGWGAEESGSRTEPGHEATMRLSRSSMTCDCPKLGLFVCCFNEFVIAFPRFAAFSDRFVAPGGSP